MQLSSAYRQLHEACAAWSQHSFAGAPWQPELPGCWQSCTHRTSHTCVQCLAHEPPLSAAHVARLLVQEAVAANNKLPEPLSAPAELRDPYSDEDDREQSDDNR